MPKKTNAAQVFKTTVELDPALADKLMTEVLKRKMTDRRYTLKQFLSDAVSEKLERDELQKGA